MGGRFKRGLVNADGKIDIADPIFLLTYLFALAITHISRSNVGGRRQLTSA